MYWLSVYSLKIWCNTGSGFASRSFILASITYNTGNEDFVVQLYDREQTCTYYDGNFPIGKVRNFDDCIETWKEFLANEVANDKKVPDL